MLATIEQHYLFRQVELIDMTSVFPLWQWNALQDFYTSTNGQYWQVPQALVHWNFTSPELNDPCTDNWVGIDCENGYVQTLVLTGANLTGTIPESIGMLSTLVILELNNNHLEGTLPHSIGNCSGLSQLILDSNHLNGSLPASLSNCTGLFELILRDNRFSGSLPPTLADLSPFYFDLALNRFTGSLPNFLCSYSYVFILDLHVNFFSGVLPSCLNQLKSLNLFDVHQNLFYGELPDMTGLKQLASLTLAANAFSGLIEDKVPANKSMISEFDIELNQFEGPLPIRSWSNMIEYYVYLNYFTGVLPCSLSTAKRRLEYLEVASNYLHGGIPPCLEHFSHLVGAYMTDNMFSGELSAFDFSTWTLTEALYIDNNFFHGKLPSSIGDMPQLLGFTASFNSLTGTFPKTFQNLTYLFQLYLEGNRLSGNLDLAFNWTNLNELAVVDLSNNQFTGPVPRGIFSAPLIESVALASNCFSGTIPDGICNGLVLSAVSLDGLSTASNCRIPLFPGIDGFDAFTVRSNIGGSIPRCLFEIPLAILHLSGNDLTGSLPSDVTLFERLKVLSLSHNRLTGTIPLNFLNRYWNNLDLSYNKFVGNLESITAEGYSWLNSSVSLEVNRLSGSIPHVLTTATNISILDGNMFSCDLKRSQLPAEDSESDIYVCGSDDINDAIYFWISAWLVPILVVLLVERKVIRKSNMKSVDSREFCITMEDTDARLPILTRRSNSLYSDERNESDRMQSKSIDNFIGGVLVDPFETIDLNSEKTYSTDSTSTLLSPNLLWLWSFGTKAWFRWQTVFEELQINRSKSNHGVNVGSNVLLFYHTMVATRSNVSWITIYILVILFPIYSVLTAHYGTYSNQYAWQVSAAFLSGMTPSLVLFFFLALFQLFSTYRIMHSVMWSRDENNDISTRAESMSSKVDKENTSQNNSTCAYLLSEPYLYVSWSFALILNLSVMLCLDSVYVYIALTYSGTVTTITQLFLAMAKLVWNENLIFFLLYHSRYWTKYLWERYTGVVTEDHVADLSVRDITVLSMISVVNKIVVPCIAIAVVNSNCFYNALYSAPPVTATFIYCDTRVPFNPCINLLASGENGETYSPPFQYGYQCSSFFLKDYVPVFVYMFAFSSIFVPFVLFCLQNLHDSFAHQILFSQYTQMHGVSRESLSTLNSLTRIADGTRFRDLYILLCDWLPQTWQCPHAVSMSKDENKSKWIMIVNTKQRTVIRINNHIAILVSFAALFPPLSFIALVSICILTYFEERNTARLIKHALMYRKHWLIQRLDRECRGVANSFRYTSVWMLFLGSWLFAFFVYDTFGDEKGHAIAIGPAIAMCCIPLAMVAARLLVVYYGKKNPPSSSLEEDGSEVTPNVEMQSFSDTSSIMEGENPLHGHSSVDSINTCQTLKPSEWKEAV